MTCKGKSFFSRAVTQDASSHAFYTAFVSERYRVSHSAWIGFQ